MTPGSPVWRLALDVRPVQTALVAEHGDSQSGEPVARALRSVEESFVFCSLKEVQ
jgi:hypothetical protein